MLVEFVRGVSSAGLAAGATAARPAKAAAGFARTAEQRARTRALDELGRTTVALVDRALVWPYTEQAVQLVLESRLAERVIAQALDRMQTADLPQVIADRLLEDGIAERLAARLLSGPELDRIAVLAIESAVLRTEAALASPAVERLVAIALTSPGMERLVSQVITSQVVEDAVTRLIDDTTARLPDSEPLWQLIDVIAQSPAVTEAITQQSVGFADQLAGDVRERTRTVDDRLERGARRLLRRRVKGTGAGGAPSASGA
jgi:hypothetical protein